MTQPAPPEAEQGVNGTTVVAVAVTGLALIAIEQRVRQEVEDDITAALAVFTAYLTVVLASPAIVGITGVQLLSRPDVHKRLTDSLAVAHSNTVATVRAGYTAATQLAQAQATTQLARAGYEVPEELPELDPSIDHILRDIDTMFGHAQTDIQNNIRAAFDGVDGEDAPTARRLIVPEAVDRARNRLVNRASIAAGTAVHQGATDAQHAIHTEYQNSTGAHLAKRWVTTSATPCGMCEALNGTVVALGTEFDHYATTITKDLRPVWRNLSGPPRHPNCRCQLELVTLSG